MYTGNGHGDKSIIRQGIDWGDIGEKFQNIIKKIIETANYIFSERGGACDETRKDDVLDKWEKINKQIIENEKRNINIDINVVPHPKYIPSENKDDDEDIAIIQNIPNSSDEDYRGNKDYSDRDDLPVYVNKYDPYGLNRPTDNRQNKDTPNRYTDYYNRYKFQEYGNRDCPYRMPRAIKDFCKNPNADKQVQKLSGRKRKQRKLTAKKLKMKTKV